MMVQSITKGLLIQDGARTVAGFSHVKFNCLDDGGRGIDVSIASSSGQGRVLDLSYHDAPESKCTLPLEAVQGDAKSKALQLFRERVPMMGLHQHPQRPEEKTLEGMMSSLNTLAAAATNHQARLQMCAKLLQTRARIANASPAGSQDHSREDGGATPTQSSGPEASPAHVDDDAVQAASSLEQPPNRNAPSNQNTVAAAAEPVKVEEAPSQAPAPSPAPTTGASPSVRSRFASKSKRKAAAATGSGMTTPSKAHTSELGAGMPSVSKPVAAACSTPASARSTGANAAAPQASFSPSSVVPPATQQGGMAATTAPAARAALGAHETQDGDVQLYTAHAEGTVQPKPTVPTEPPAATAGKPPRPRKRRKPVDEAFA